MIKRLLDLTVAIVGLIVLSPLLLVVAILIKLDSPGSVLYRGARIGKNGAPFDILKFRSMVANADRRGSALTHRGDPRVTKVGRFLRKWKVDEIPQLLNVIRGEMSLVGPRPESPDYVAHYTPEQMQVLQARPGMTGLTQIEYRHEEVILNSYADRETAYLQEVMPRKLALDLQYIQSRSLLVDLGLIVRTFLCLFQRDSSAQEGLGVPEPRGG